MDGVSNAPGDCGRLVAGVVGVAEIDVGWFCCGRKGIISRKKRRAAAPTNIFLANLLFIAYPLFSIHSRKPSLFLYGRRTFQMRCTHCTYFYGLWRTQKGTQP